MNRKHYAHIFIFTALAVFVCSCSFGIRAPDFPAGPHASTGSLTPSAGSILARLGEWCIYAGAVAAILGALGKVAARTPYFAFLIAFDAILSEAIILGSVAVIIGSVVLWVGLHSWVLWLVVGIAGTVYAVRHLDVIYAAWGSFKGLVRKRKTIPVPSQV